MPGHRQGRPDGRTSLGPRGEAAYRRHGRTDEEEDGNLRRRVCRGGERLYQAAGQSEKALLLLGEHHPYASVYAYEAKESGTGGTMAVAVSRLYDRRRQERRPTFGSARRVRYRREYLRDVQHRQWPAHEYVARWSHDTVPQREEYQLGRRVPGSHAGAVARKSRSGFDLERDCAAS